MSEYEIKDFSKLIKRGALEARREMKLSDSTVARIYDRNLDSFYVTVELYSSYCKIVNYRSEELSEEEKEITIDIVNRYAYIERDKIIFQERKKRDGKEQHTTQATEALVTEVKESGLLFEVDLTSHIDTGLFLDMANVREIVRERALNKTVLNLFSYTGSFSVYAASSPCKKVTSVDLSNTYTAWAVRNFERNGFIQKDIYPCISMDAKKFVEEKIQEKEQYDIIVLDPPSFSNSNKMETPFDVKKDHVWWILSLNKILSNHGELFFSSNLSNFSLDKTRLSKYYKITELTKSVRANGFSQDRNSLRIWLLEKVSDVKGVISQERSVREYTRTSTVKKDEKLEELALRWEEDEKFDSKVSNEKATHERRQDRPRREFSDRGGRREFSDRPRRDNDRPRFNEERGERRSYSDRPRFNEERGERRSYSDKPRFNDNDRREFSDRPRRDNDRPRFNEERGERRSYSDRPRRDEGERRSYSDRPRFNEERGDRREFSDRPRRDNDRPRFNDSERGERRSYSDRPRRDEGERRSYSDRPRFNDGERGERRSYSDRPRFNEERGERREFSDRPRRDNDRPRFNDERRSFDRDSKPRFENSERPRREKKSTPKPFGYDRFKESKSRNDGSFSPNIVRSNEEDK